MRATQQPRPRWSRTGWAHLGAAPASVSALVLLLYALWLGIILPHSHDARDFINVGRGYILRGHGSALIRVDPYAASLANPGGFDGQFAYYIALDPLHATTYLDEPAYRLSRILYPLLARALALGQPTAIPYALLATNWLALAGGTFALAAWLRRRGLSAWFALIYGLYPGLFEGVRYDLTEPLCYALVALAIYLIDFGGPRRIVWAGMAFALAALARESALFFAIPYGIAQLFARPTPAHMPDWPRPTASTATAQPLAQDTPTHSPPEPSSSPVAATPPPSIPIPDPSSGPATPTLSPGLSTPTRPQSRTIPPTDGTASPNGSGTPPPPPDPSGSRPFHDPSGSGHAESGRAQGSGSPSQDHRLGTTHHGPFSSAIALAYLPNAATLLTLAGLPLLAWRLFLYLRLGTFGAPAWAFQSQPFAGFRAYYPWAPAQIEEIRSIVLPAAICALMALWALWRRCWAVEIWILLLNIWLFVVLLAPGSVNDYLNSGRISAGVVLATITCIPHLDRLTGRNRWWLWSSAALWLSLVPFWLLIPIADSLLTAHH